MLKYIGIAFLIGIVSGVIHNIILFRHVMPYMKNRGFESQGPFGAFQLGKIMSEYFKMDDPGEKKTKIILRCLKIPFFIAFLIAAFGIFVASRANIGG